MGWARTLRQRERVSKVSGRSGNTELAGGARSGAERSASDSLKGLGGLRSQDFLPSAVGEH